MFIMVVGNLYLFFWNGKSVLLITDNRVRKNPTPDVDKNENVKGFPFSCFKKSCTAGTSFCNPFAVNF